MDETQLLDWLAIASLQLTPRQLGTIKGAGIPIQVDDETQLRLLLKRIGYDLTRYRSRQQRLDRAAELLSILRSDGWGVISRTCKQFPPLLKQIDDPPLLLFYKGDPELLLAPQVAIVGSRKSTALGRDNARRIAQQLSEAGITVTSGLAIGIDSAAHQGAITSGSGGTLAVMATGPDRIYPPRNMNLARAILSSGGTLITEKLPGTSPRPYHFPERNRLISGLSLATLVVEADLRSGSLVTARTALEQGREVLAMPGATSNPAARGCHQLIKEGAALVESVEDLLASIYLELHAQTDIIAPTNPSVPQDPGVDEDPILRAFGGDLLSVDELINLTGCSSEFVSAHLTELEISGRIARQGGRFIKLC